MNNILTTQDSGTGSQDIQKSQIYYSPYPRKSLSLKKSSFISGSQLKNMNQSAIQFTTTNPTNATKDIQQNEIGQQRNFNFENAEKVLNRWQDLGLIDGPDTEQMMMKYPEQGTIEMVRKLTDIKMEQEICTAKFNNLLD
ncbi:tetratricopeptide repeat protein (macronuclear) [Tetrahymena thermophila SB210]|uniref:Tetratricopeptide repeat protein n=1 Tax=Tetrahymena thermophila (strain SB210) TaxID=312017 RepID=Q224Q5_TETTS|nr:tetratricopeptide repeat protein [Tetrahymena thermophila SB210]EAR80771.2 tetratricopeptide repeat protein [Tetrahymena thermophila SB210]|eukprot:XP_001028434.2 tetratricopeptide repeat protein [Tetrahymena thermophila SB210]